MMPIMTILMYNIIFINISRYEVVSILAILVLIGTMATYVVEIFKFTLTKKVDRYTAIVSLVILFLFGIAAKMEYGLYSMLLIAIIHTIPTMFVLLKK